MSLSMDNPSEETSSLNEVSNDLFAVVYQGINNRLGNVHGPFTGRQTAVDWERRRRTLLGGIGRIVELLAP